MLSGTNDGLNTARFWQGVDTQLHVIGALLMRELHTRYGRDNIGYLWVILEPMLLAGAVASLHVGNKSSHYGPDFRPIPFALTGYCVFIIFRSVVSRAESAIDANKPLLFHRMVTIFDMLAARAVLEVVATTATLIVLLSGAWALNLATPPGRPLTLLAGIGFMAWLSFAVSMPICAATYLNKAVAKFVHPAIYILMPISGAFFLLSWIPNPFRTWLTWSPVNQIFEMVFTGLFQSVDSPYFNTAYISGWCLALTFIGMLSIRIVRRHVHLN